MRRALFAALLAGALIACERIAGVEDYHVCEGAECDAGAIDSGGDSAKSACSGIDAGTAACGACIAKSCASAAAACGCDSVCVGEVECYTHGSDCSTCERTKTTTNAFIKCAADSCAGACSCK